MNTFNTESAETTFTKEQLETWAENAAKATDSSAGSKSPTRVAEPIDSAAEKPKKAKKQKQKRGENQPKRPMSAYMLFLNENREAIKAALLENSEKVSVGEIARAGGLQWMALEDTAKDVFIERSITLKEEYAAAMKTWRTEHPEEVAAKKTEKKAKAKTAKTGKSTFKPDDAPEAPPGMSGPFQGYLTKTVKNSDGKASFKDFLEAVTAAMELGDDCGGITRTARGWSLRKAITPSNEYGGDGVRKEVSYIKSQFVSEELAGQIIDTNSTIEESETEPAPEPVQTEEKPKKKRGRPAKKAEEPKEVEKAEEPKETTPEPVQETQETPEPVQETQEEVEPVEETQETPEPVQETQEEVEPVEEAGGKSDDETQEEVEEPAEEEDDTVYSDDEVETISWEFKGKDYEVAETINEKGETIFKVYAEDEDGEYELVGYREIREITKPTKSGKSKTKKEFFIAKPWEN